MTRTFKLTIAYDGSEFAGWQVQPGKATIQGTLQQALRHLTGESVQVIGSGRTDAGVHAFGQVASLSVPWRDTPRRLAAALNANLPDTIVVTSAEDAPDGFHAIRDAVSKRYRYQLQVGGDRDVFEYRYRWHLHSKIDLELITRAAGRLIGRHDFAGFQAAGSDRRTTTRDVRACELFQQPSTDPNRLYLAIEIEADGFLYNMVRNIVGTLVEIGRGKQPPEWIDQIIESGNRDIAGQTAPAHALFLVRVGYPPSANMSVDPDRAPK